MKINNIKDTTAQMLQHYQRNVGVGASGDKPATATGVPEEKVDLSAKAKDLLQMNNIASQIPEIREDKVQQLRIQIEKGLYDINSEKIAAKMVGESLVDIFA
jgi:negative regulator of flagellin synthesis FlgM